MRRLHPISGLIRAVTLGVTVGSMGAFAGFGLTAVFRGDLDAAVSIGLAVLGFIAGVVLGVTRYYQFAYDVSGGTLSIQSGVFDRQERDIPLSRIQNVDIRRNLLNRITGIAVVRFETAGGSSTEGVLNAVARAEARRLQDAVAQGRSEESESFVGNRPAAAVGEGATGKPAATGELGEAGPADSAAGEAQATPGDADTESEEEVFRLSTRELVVLSLVSFRPAAPLFVIFGLPIVSDLAIRLFSRSLVALGGPRVGSFEGLFALPTAETLFVVVVGGIQLFLVTWVTSALLTANGHHDFRLTRVGEDLRYERGFLQRYSGTIPLGKVQTVTVKENVLMRQLGYGALALETAGYGTGGSGDAANTAVPLDERERVLALAEELGPAALPEIDRPPRRARRRYAVRFSLAVLALAGVLFAVDAVLVATPWWLALGGLLVTPAAGHLRWRHRGHALTDGSFVAREGFWRRRTSFVPYYRVQTAIDERTVFQRWRELASVTADTASTASIVGTDATAHDIDEATAKSLHPTLLERLQENLAPTERANASSEPATEG